MTMSEELSGSITRWIDGLKAGHPEAAEALWRHYYERVVTVARRRLRFAPHQAVEDAEDVALGAFHGLCDGLAHGRFPQLNDRVDLWKLLVAITVKKALAQRRRYRRRKRGGDHVIHGHDDALDLVPGTDESPESAAIIREQIEILLNALGDRNLRQIALWRLDGSSNAEISQKMGCVLRTVERKLERIRLIWHEMGIEPDE
jgi:RNA polymerase sigma factor (sigma-70 family)